MTTTAELKKELYQKIEALPANALKDASDAIDRIKQKRTEKNYFNAPPISGEVLINYLFQNYEVQRFDWQIQSLFGIKIDKEFLTIDFVENLFKNADFEFYQNKEKTHIFSQKMNCSNTILES